jgi:predicted PurR-regulated permease PerM
VKSPPDGTPQRVYLQGIWQSGINAVADSARDRLQRPLFYLLVFVATYLTYLVLSPFLVPLTWAAVFAILLRRPQVTLSRKMGPNLAALVTVLLTAFVIVGPAVTLASAVAREMPSAVRYIQQASLTAPSERVWDFLRLHSPVALPDEPAELLQQAIERAIAFLAPRAGGLVADLLATLGSLVTMLFALFFLLRDGDAIGHHLRAWLPVSDHEAERLISDTRDLVVASVGASVLVALAQGTIGGLAFWLLGFRGSLLWAAATAFCSIVPVVGAALVWAPAAIWLMLGGAVGRGIILVLVGVFGISLADHVLRLLLLSGRTAVGGFVIFFGLLGGVAVFGFVGIVIGPIILVTTGSLFRLLARSDHWTNQEA